MTRVHDAAGTPIAATFDLEVHSDDVSLVLHSAGGAGHRGGVPRNANYPQGLETILRRLGQLGASITDAYVDSAQVSHLTLDERQLVTADWDYPIHLATVDDYDRLRKQLTGAQKRIGRPPGDTRPGGNERRRIRLHLEVPGFPPTADSIDRLELIIAHSQGSPDQEQPSQGRPSGQGFITDTPTKLVIEAAAMAAADAYYRDGNWEVQDVSARASYDLHCSRGGEERRVEVKGTTNPPAAVLLTPNEVSHALMHPDQVALFVLSDIVITIRDGKPVASGGTTTVFDPWRIDLERLTATGYSYALDGVTQKEPPRQVN